MRLESDDKKGTCMRKNRLIRIEELPSQPLRRRLDSDMKQDDTPQITQLK